MSPRRRRLLLLAAAAGALVSLAGCPGEPEDPCPGEPVGEPSLEILGSPEESGTTVEPIVDGAARALIRGNQAGFHVWVNLDARGICLRGVTIRSRMIAVDTGETIVEQAERLTFHSLPGDPTTGRLAQAFAFFQCPDSLGRRIDGRQMRMEIEVVDARGRRAADTAVIVPTCDMAVQGGMYFDACRRECAGTVADGGAATDASLAVDGG